MAVQLVEDRVVAVLEDQVELPFAPEHLDQVHQVGVFELLQGGGDTAASSLTYCLTAAHKHAVAPGNRLTSAPIYEPPVPSRPLTPLAPRMTNERADCWCTFEGSSGLRPSAGLLFGGFMSF